MVFSLNLSPEVRAQGRIGYQDLVQQQRNQNIYLDFFVLPGSDDQTVQFVNTFRMDYSFLPFKKLNSSGNNERFFSTVSMNMEVFKAEERVKRKDKISIEGLQAVNRDFWKDTAYAENYQQTQSNNTFIGGFMQVQLKPGLYNYLLQLNRNDFAKEENSRIRQVYIGPYRNQRNGSIIYVEGTNNKSTPSTLKLMNFGDNVFYGKDFSAFVHLPDYDPDAKYAFRVFRVEASRDDTTRRNQVLEQDLTRDQIMTGLRPTLEKRDKNSFLVLNKVQNGFNYALVKIPNSKFPNAVYQLEVYNKSKNKPVATSIFRSLWLQMPISLLNLDVAIDMLRFIEGRDTINKIKDGSGAEVERKFREYWKSKDPTPNTEYNELMTEYYRRIDYAYQHFTTINSAGYESDQGQVYIKYGPPQQVERKFPPGEPAVEIWTYGKSQQFVFQATSGFGDFRLVGG